MSMHSRVLWMSIHSRMLKITDIEDTIVLAESEMCLCE